MELIHADMAETAVIIPNYNGLKFMDKCIRALMRQTYRDFRVIVVDNGSDDGSAVYLKELEDSDNGLDICCLLLKENTGFSGAVNAGIDKAAGSRYIVLLNNDTEAEPDYLKELIRPFEEDREERIAAVTPMMIKMFEPDILDDAGDGYNLFGWAFQRGVGQPVITKAFNKPSEVFSACAGAAAYRLSSLDEIKLWDAEGAGAYFDPMHFAYLEDVDVSFRLRARGYRIVYAPDSRVLHVGSGTSGSRYNDFKVRLAARNNIYLNYKNMPVIMLLINLPWIAAGMVIKQLFFLKAGFGRAYLSGVKEGLKTVGKCRKNKTFFKAARLMTYIRIELMLIADTFFYIRDFVIRQKNKLVKRGRS